MKVSNSSHINPFGGLNYVLDTWDSLGLGTLLNKHLPRLAAQSTYTWKDLLYGFWSIYFTGGDCIEDLQGNLSHHLKDNRSFKVASPDRLLDRFKELTVPFHIPDSQRGTKQHHFSFNPLLNHLNLDILKATGFGSDPRGYTLDYDNTIVFSEKSDCTNTYKRGTGYCPAVGLIDKRVVYVENRGGHSSPGSLQADTLGRMFTLLKEKQIAIDCFRADSASYQYEVVKLVRSQVHTFYIAARRSGGTARAIASIGQWSKYQRKSQVSYLGETTYTPFQDQARKAKELDQLRTYRLIVNKVPREDGQIDLFTGEACEYRLLLTNDWKHSVEQVMEIYHQRGAAEREFDVLKNDFGWDNMPFSKMEQNTVFLIFTAICRNLYHYIIHTYSSRIKGLLPSFRIKKFIFRFITIPAKWVRKSRQYHLKLYGKIDWKPG